MSKILIINGAKRFPPSNGSLNHKFARVATEHLVGLGHSVSTIVVDDGYDIEQEVQKIAQSDVIIYQMPAWWMGAPWTIKKYLDEVFTTGYGVLYASDGRTRSDPARKYGSGGLLHGKRYMLSLTWNAPLEAFNDPDQFFEGVGVEAVYLPFHKANQFLGLEPIPSFIANDVEKNPQIEADLDRFAAHLDEHFRPGV
ncbi:MULTISPECIES: NAD(P)H-dependent oxidoreductase [Burkholderia]|uniref:NAD(P)H-dependent oxidoreductase n=1 Tax=Burkholderia TaxID=32008 RepID=UPI000F592956|nr:MULTISPECIES: NAD(P)H-dependent oxidoreductase [Burkholderia cepacia complex]MBN3745147.1 NAD(P)H-dependent oxidoreductase [Burkholderia sp. Se-20373]RQS69935.1 flavodoxin family protein [Burkholderia seminalis]RQT43298.1 flavodoxin family protein [Burkholderia cepacia]